MLNGTRYPSLSINITQRGHTLKTVAGLLSVDELEDYLELRDPKVNKQQIIQSKKDYDAGRFGSARALLAEQDRYTH